MLLAMPTWPRGLQIGIACVSLLVGACGTAKPRAPGEQELVRTTQPSAPVDELYAADEALRDALSGPWTHVGTGPWPGNNRMFACAFRNQRVLVVNAYCSISETHAVRIDVYSPSRGRARIYAEGNGALSTSTRSQYFTFTAESEPPPTPAAGLPPLQLGMSFEQLRTYEEQRYAASLPGCFGGQERMQERTGCLGALASRAPTWRARNNAFLERASEDWYRLVREARALAARFGKEPS
jgi:hypothetical protein